GTSSWVTRMGSRRHVAPTVWGPVAPSARRKTEFPRSCLACWSWAVESFAQPLVRPGTLISSQRWLRWPAVIDCPAAVGSVVVHPVEHELKIQKWFIFALPKRHGDAGQRIC